MSATQDNSTTQQTDVKQKPIVKLQVGGDSTRKEDKIEERKAELGVCRIRKFLRDGAGYQTVGSGAVVKNLAWPWKDNCCIITSDKVLAKEDFDINDFYLDFKKWNSDKPKPKTFKLGNIAMSDAIHRCASGLVVIPLRNPKPCKIKKPSSILTYRPFTKGNKSVNELLSPIVDDMGSSGFDVKPCLLKQMPDGKFVLHDGPSSFKTLADFTGSSNRKPHGSVILSRGKNMTAVGILHDDGPSGISPVWLSDKTLGLSPSAEQPTQVDGRHEVMPANREDLPGQMLMNLQQMQQDVSKVSSDTNLLAELEKIASDKGFVISDNKGSGNCMFYALSEQLNLVKGMEISHRELRQSIVQYLRKNPKRPDGTDLFNFIYEYQSWDDYLSNMEQDGTCGDHVILYATANCYKMHIRVISSQSNHGECTIKPDGHVMSTNPLVLGHVLEVHYVSLKPKGANANGDKASPSSSDQYTEVDSVRKGDLATGPRESNTKIVQQQYANEARTRKDSGSNTKTENEGASKYRVTIKESSGPVITGDYTSVTTQSKPQSESNRNTDQQQHTDKARTRSASNTKIENEGASKYTVTIEEPSGPVITGDHTSVTIQSKPKYESNGNTDQQQHTDKARTGSASNTKREHEEQV